MSDLAPDSRWVVHHTDLGEGGDHGRAMCGRYPATTPWHDAGPEEFWAAARRCVDCVRQMDRRYGSSRGR